MTTSWFKMTVTGSDEDRFGEECGDDPVGHVHDLADLEIDRDTRDHVGLLAREPAFLDQVIDHVADRLLGRGKEIGTVRCRGEVWPAVRLQPDRPGRAEA